MDVEYKKLIKVLGFCGVFLSILTWYQSKVSTPSEWSSWSSTSQTLGIENNVDRVHRNLVLGRFCSNFLVGYFLCFSVASCHQISWNHFLLDLLAKIIVLGSFNLNYLSKEKNYEVILMGVILHLVIAFVIARIQPGRYCPLWA